MFCTNCGNKLEVNYKFCPECGCAVIHASAPEMTYFGAFGSVPSLGTMVSVLLIGGAVQSLFMRNGMYFYDTNCTRPFPAGMIMGPCNPGSPSTNLSNPLWFYDPKNRNK